MTTRKKARVRETLSYIDQPKKKRLKGERFLDQPRGGRWKKAGILIAVFVLAILISSLVLNQGTRDITVGLSDPDLPRGVISGEESAGQCAGRLC